MRIKQFINIISLMITTIYLSGCATIQQHQQISDQMRTDQIKFYSHLSNTYYTLGYEYFTLARELEQNKQLAKSQQMARKAKMYQELSQDLSEYTTVLEQRYQIQTKPTQPQKPTPTTTQPPLPPSN